MPVTHIMTVGEMQIIFLTHVLTEETYQCHSSLKMPLKPLFWRNWSGAGTLEDSSMTVQVDTQVEQTAICHLYSSVSGIARATYTV